MLDDETRKALLLAHLRESIIYHTAAEAGLDVPDAAPELLPELGIDMAALAAGTMAAVVECYIAGDQADLLHPSPQAREIAADLVRKILDGQTPTAADLWWMGE